MELSEGLRSGLALGDSVRLSRDSHGATQFNFFPGDWLPQGKDVLQDDLSGPWIRAVQSSGIQILLEMQTSYFFDRSQYRQLAGTLKSRIDSACHTRKDAVCAASDNCSFADHGAAAAEYCIGMRHETERVHCLVRYLKRRRFHSVRFFQFLRLIR